MERARFVWKSSVAFFQTKYTDGSFDFQSHHILDICTFGNINVGAMLY